MASILEKMNKHYLVLTFAFVSLIACAVKPKVMPIAKTITIFYTNDFNLNNITRIAQLVKQERSKNPCLFIIKGQIFSNAPITTLLRGEAEITILNQAGVDAVILAPDFLRFGIKRAKELINQGDFFFLAANLQDANQARPLAQEYLIKDLAKTKISLLGILTDSTNLYLKLSGIERKEPMPIVKRLVPMLRMRSDLVGLATTDNNSITFSDIDFIVGTTDSQSSQGGQRTISQTEVTLYRFDLFLSGNNGIIDYQNSKVFFADTVTEDSIVKATIQRYQVLTDSILDSRIIKIKKDLTIENLVDIITQAVLAETKADGFIFQKPLVKNSIPKGSFNYRQLLDVLAYCEKLLILPLKGREIQLLKGKQFEIVLSPKLKKSKIIANQDYQIVTTTELTAIDLTKRAITLTDSSLASIVFNYFAKARR